MEKSIFSATFLVVFILSTFLTGCAEKNLANIQVEKLAEFSDRLGQANVKLYRYSGELEKENIEAFSEKLGCNMLYAYFYPDTVPLSEIPIEEVQSAKSYTQVHDTLYNGEGYARWRFTSRCFAVISIVTDCNESRVSQDCRSN